MKTHDLAKLTVYKASTIYLRFYMLVYLYVFILAAFVTVFNKALDNSVWAGVKETLSGKALTFEFLYFLLMILLIATAVFNVVMMPMLNKTAYWSIFIHQGALLLCNPLILVLNLAFHGTVKGSVLLQNGIIYAIEAAFAVINIIYFSKRKELFYSDIVKYITGKEKDLTKH